MRAGHEVHLLCQDRAPLELPWVDAAGDWDGGALELRGPPRPAARDRLPAGPRRAAAGLRRRPLRRRSRRGPFEELDEAEVAALRGAQRRRRGGGRRARPPGRRARQPPGDGPADPRPRARGHGRALRGQDPRQRAGVHGQAASALPARRARGARGRARGARRLAPHGGEPVGGAGGARAARRGPASARPASTSPASRRASRTRPPRASQALRASGSWRPAADPRRPARPTSPRSSRSSRPRRPRRSARSTRGATGSSSSSAS